MIHVVFVGGECYDHWFINFEWFYPVIDNLKDKFGKPREVWHSSLFEQVGTASFIPVFCILSKLLMLQLNIGVKTLMVIISNLNFPYV